MKTYTQCNIILYTLNAKYIYSSYSRTRMRGWNIHCMLIQEYVMFKYILLGKISDVASKISISDPSFYSIYFAVTLHDSNISFVLCRPSAYITWLSSEKVLWKFPEDRWKFVEYKANMRFTMQCNCSGCWMGWGGGGWTYWEFSICYGIILKSINQCLNWPTLSVLQNI